MKILRALVKETMSRAQVDMLTADIEAARQTLDEKDRTTGSEREQVEQGSGY